jgi:hypothetical protein
MKSISKRTAMQTIVGVVIIFAAPALLTWLWNNAFPDVVYTFWSTVKHTDTIPNWIKEFPNISYWHWFFYTSLVATFVDKTTFNFYPSDDSKNGHEYPIAYSIALMTVTTFIYLLYFIFLTNIVWNRWAVNDFSSWITLPTISTGQLLTTWLVVKLIFGNFEISFVSDSDSKELKDFKKDPLKNISIEDVLKASLELSKDSNSNDTEE